MICPQCNNEMSKKWHPSAAKVTVGAAVVWACGVCGCQLTQADMKLSAKHAAEPVRPGSTATQVGIENDSTRNPR
jgi:hypothetical protein